MDARLKAQLVSGAIPGNCLRAVPPTPAIRCPEQHGEFLGGGVINLAGRCRLLSRPAQGRAVRRRLKIQFRPLLRGIARRARLAEAFFGHGGFAHPGGRCTPREDRQAHPGDDKPESHYGVLSVSHRV